MFAVPGRGQSVRARPDTRPSRWCRAIASSGRAAPWGGTAGWGAGTPETYAGRRCRHTRLPEPTPRRHAEETDHDMQMKQITMDPAVPRSIAKLQYAAARLPFTLLDEYVIARYWGQHAPVRVGLERWLGSLDLLAGRLLADDEISRRGETLMRQTRDPAQARGHAVDAPAPPAHSGHVPPDLPAAGQAPELRDQIAAFGEQEDSQQVRQAVGEQVTAGHAPPAADPAQTGDGAGAAGLPGTPYTPAARTAPVDVTFTLPAEVQAG